MNCYNCDTLIEENWNYCPNCKRKLRKNKIGEEEFSGCNEAGKCHTCSCELNSNWNFCPICGTSVEFYSDKAYLSVPTIATNDQVTTVSPIVVPVLEEKTVLESVQENQTVTDENTIVQIPGVIYCPNCGVQATEEHLFCAYCGTGLRGQASVSTNANDEEKSDYGYIPWLILSVLGGPSGVFLARYVNEGFLTIGYFISLFAIIYAKIKYPKSKVVTTVFIIFVTMSVIALIFFLVIIVVLMIACDNCLGELSRCS